ncbi:Heme-degrading monooxygenase HmoA [Sphingomonas laterariae]|uniref:Heme-degrading monooxygenase HmoA n=1 Tax=Edaphosphingomonas laterariae TaxID=861865 RepID=A0A239CW52_9SPHN|nr:antibiotic biosynthesis monooxygenase [Sphingomonas laterariae]SNS23881.1 Heme-degrading monooxygenase HmoA [Sphingomonas laterariae]
MENISAGCVAVIFVNRRTADDDAGYHAAAQAMVEEAGRQPGFVGIHSVRATDGEGITISYWADEAAALAWRKNAEHAAIREQGRARWYEYYHLIVAEVRRDYQWHR